MSLNLLMTGKVASIPAELHIKASPPGHGAERYAANKSTTFGISLVACILWLEAPKDKLQGANRGAVMHESVNSNLKLGELVYYKNIAKL